MAIQFIKDVNVNGDLTATRLIKLGGTSSQFLKADGSVDSTGYLSSVGLTMPVAFSVANSPLMANGTLEVTAIGTASQYIRGDGQLATLPAGGGGGGSSVFYYLNGSVDASVATYKQMDNTPVIGGGTDFNLVGNGLIAQFLTDIGNPNRIQIPGGAWNFEMFFNMSSVGGNTKFYVELLKYNGATFISIASNITVPEEITGGTSVDLYLTSIAVPETVLLTTDRLAIRVYIVDNSGGRTATLHTEDNTLCQVTTTFSAGVTSINGLTANTQYLAVGTSGTDFNISSLLDTHTFNLPTASSTKRGALSIGDWTAFNNKANASGTINYISKFTGASSLGNSIVYDDGTKVGIGTISPMYKLDVNGDISLSIGSYYKVGGTNLVNDSQYIPKATTLGYFVNSLIYDSGTNIGIGTTAPTQQLTTTGDAIIRNAYIGYIPAFGVNYASFSHASRNNANDYSLLSENNGTTYLNASLVQSIKFRIGNFDKAIIDSNGNFGIGTTIPTAKLDVNGVIKGAGLDYHTLSVADGGAQLRLERTGSASGLMYIGADNVGFRVFDASFNTRLLVASSGNVGIGNTSPAEKLDVSGNIFMGGSGGRTLTLQASGAGGTEIKLLPNTTAGYARINVGNTNQPLDFQMNNADVMRITQAGNVGIGTTSPTAKLDVNGHINVTSAAINFGGSGSPLSTDPAIYRIGGVNDLAFAIGLSERMRISAAGNVGIGTASPTAAKLVLNSGTTNQNALINGDKIGFTRTSDAAEVVYFKKDISLGTEGTANINGYDGIQFRTQGVETVKAVITSSGNVGIGTTSPGAKLEVVGNINITNNFVAYPEMNISGANGGFINLKTNGNLRGFLYGNDGGLSLGAEGARNIDFYTNGSQKAIITSAGNVGIGTSSPSYKLDIIGNLRLLVNNEAVIFQSVNSNGNYITMHNGSGGYGYIGSNFHLIGGGSASDLGIRGESNLVFSSGGAVERMRITSGGNVGIGTTSPLTALSVSGNLSLFTTNQIRLYNSAKNNWAEISSPLLGGDTEVDFKLVTKSGIVYVDPSGNVGIGTTSPSAKLEVAGNIFSNAGNGEGFKLNGGLALYRLDGVDLGLYTDSTERMRITSAGNVGIGTTSPGEKLDVNGAIKTSSLLITGSNFYSGIGNQISGAYGVNDYVTANFSGSGNMILVTNATERMRITSGGNLLLGLTSDFGYLLSVNGTSYFQGTVLINGAATFNTLGTGLVYSNAGVLTSTNPSDSRLKNNIADLNYGLNEILKLRPVTYNWKNDTINQGKQFGFIAQEVQEVMPELVKEFETEEGERLGLDKEGIYATLVKAIQEQQKQIEELKTLINK